MKFLGNPHSTKRKTREGKKGLLEHLLGFLRDPLPISKKRLDSRFKYQYAFDRFRTDGPVSEDSLSGAEKLVKPAFKSKAPNNPLEPSYCELERKRSELFSDQALQDLKSFSNFTYNDARLFFRLAETYSPSELKAAYHEYVMLHHPDHSNAFDAGLAEKRVQLANMFKEMLQRSA